MDSGNSQTPSRAGKRLRSEEPNGDARGASDAPQIVVVDLEDEPQDKEQAPEPTPAPPAPLGEGAAAAPTETQQKVPTPPVPLAKRFGDRPPEKPKVQLKLVSSTHADTFLKTIAERDTSLLEKDRCIEELTQRCAALENALSLERSNSARAEASALAWESSVQKYREVLTDVMRDAARTQRREARRAEHNMHFDLGHIFVSQSSINHKELWVEGNRKREMDVVLSDLTAKIADVDMARKHLMRTNRKKGGENDDEAALLDTDEQMQILNHSLSSLQQAKSEVEGKLGQLQAEKTAFLKEIRRITDEDSSEFANVQSLHKGRYVLISLLGKGGFSEVWKAFDVETPQFVACKIHRISREWSLATREHYLKHAHRELDIMGKLDHPRLTKLYNIFEQDDNTFVSVQELSEGTDLDTYLKRYGKMRESDARIIMIQLISALRHLAEQESPIIHYDLKPANIIFHSAFPACLDIKVTDFGLSKVIKESGNAIDPSIELTSQGTGTYWYLPPECFETNGITPPKISSKVDIWAAGIIFYQLLYGKRPFAEGESQKRIWQDKLIVSAARTFEFPAEPKISESTKEIIQLCLRYNAAERPDVISLSKLPYFRGKVKGASNQASKMLPPSLPSVSKPVGSTSAPSGNPPEAAPNTIGANSPDAPDA